MVLMLKDPERESDPERDNDPEPELGTELKELAYESGRGLLE